MDTPIKDTPEATNLVAISYDDAMKMYIENGRRSFSFVAAPYGVLKTVASEGANIVAAPPAIVLQRVLLRQRMKGGR